MIEIYNADCLQKMKDIKSGSVDMILCDLPYGTIGGLGKGIEKYALLSNSAEWDNTINTNELFNQYERVLRMNGVAVLFSQEPYTSHLRTFKSENFNFLYPMIWEKDHFANCLLAIRRLCHIMKI